MTTVDCDDDRAYLRASGHLDLGGADVLRAVVDGHVRAGRRYLRLDVGNVSWFGPLALNVLVATHRQLLDDRGTLVLTGVRPELAEMFALSGAELFQIAPTAAERTD